MPVKADIIRKSLYAGGDSVEEEDENMIDFEEELSHYKPSLEIDAVEDAIGKSDLTDMTDIMMELIKERKE